MLENSLRNYKLYCNIKQEMEGRDAEQRISVMDILWPYEITQTCIALLEITLLGLLNYSLLIGVK